MTNPNSYEGVKERIEGNLAACAQLGYYDEDARDFREQVYGEKGYLKGYVDCKMEMGILTDREALKLRRYVESAPVEDESV